MKLEELALSAVRQLSKQPRLTNWVAARTSWDNPFGDERSRYPYPIFERERAHGPIYWHRIYQSWVALGYEECQQFLVSPDFSSGHSMGQLLDMWPYKRLSPSSREFIRNLLIFVDGDAHSRLRRLVTHAFTPGKVAVLEPKIREIADQLLADMLSMDAAPMSNVDLVESFTSKLPVQVIGELLGVPRARWDWLYGVTNEMTKLLDPIRGFDPAEMDTALLELRGYLMALADTRRQTPTDDLISALVEVDDDGDQLSLEELVGLVGTLLFAGSETTTGLMGNAIVSLGRYPDQRALLIDDPTLWPNAIEEFLRYDPPITFVPRTATRDTVVHGTAIKAGQMVEVMVAAANRDPRRYHEPDQLRLDRANPTPISFGHGIHYCVGAALARTSARVGLQAFVETYENFRVDPAEVTWRTSATLRGPQTLPCIPAPVAANGV